MSQTLVRASRRLSLLSAFLVVSAVILACAAVALGVALSRVLRHETITEARRTAEHYVDRVLRPSVVRDDRVRVGARVPATADRDLALRQADIVSVKVWTPDGTLAWTRLEPARIGRRYPVNAGLAASLRRGRTSAEFVTGDGDDDRAELRAEARTAPARLLEVYTPVRGAGGR